MILHHLTYLLLIGYVVFTRTAVRLTNIKCEAYDAPFATFSECKLKILRRGVIATNLHVILYQVPVSNVSINVSLHKKANGYRPFLYNLSVDFCEFMSHRTRYPHLKIVSDAIFDSSNINHTCPYNHDIIMRNWVLEEETFRFVPLPEGEYGLFIKVGAYNDWKAEVKVYFSIKGEFSFKGNSKKPKNQKNPIGL